MEFRNCDVVISTSGRVGYIKDVCHCDKCKERGFYEFEINWIDNPEEYDYVSVYDFKNGLEKRFLRIGEHTFEKKKSNVVKEIEEIKILRPKDSYLENKFHDKDYTDKCGNLLRKVYDEHKIIISGITQSNDEFSIEIAANGKEVGIKYNLP